MGKTQCKAEFGESWLMTVTSNVDLEISTPMKKLFFFISLLLVIRSWWTLKPLVGLIPKILFNASQQKDSGGTDAPDSAFILQAL